MSSRRDAASGSASKRRSRADGDGVGEESSTGRGVGIPEIGSPTAGVARCELCGVDCSSGPRLRSKKTGAYRHRECPDEATARELLREERRAARAAARGEAYVTSRSDTKTSEERTPRRSASTPRSVPSGRPKSVRWGDAGGSDAESANGTPVSSRDRQMRRRARGSEDGRRAGSPSEDSGEDLDSGTRRRRSRPREEKRRSPDGRHRDASRRDARGRERRRSARDPRARFEALDVAFFRNLYESTPPRTRLAVGAALAVVCVSRASISAAVALAGAFASLAAIGAAAAEAYFVNARASLSPATIRRRLAPALEAARVLLGWLEASASAAVAFAAGVFATLAAALADAARRAKKRRDAFLRGVEDRRRAPETPSADDERREGAPPETETFPSATVSAETASLLPVPTVPPRPTEATEDDDVVGSNANDANANDASEKNANDASPTRAPRDAKRRETANADAFRVMQIDLAEALDELTVTRRELDAARADAEAARRGRAGAVERAAAAAVTTTRAENRDAAEALEREIARCRLEGSRAAADAAAEARRLASEEHARLRETVRDLEARLAEAEHLSSARDALEQAARAKAAETRRELVQAESRHEAETRAAAEDRARFELEVLRKAEETAESARRAAGEAVDAARRETARELLSASRAAEAERARLAAVKERVERDWRLATERADAAEEEAGATLEAARAAEGFLQKATERAAALQSEVDALRGEKKHLWERAEYAEWRLAKLGLDAAKVSPEESAVAARPGGFGTRDASRDASKRRDASVSETGRPETAPGSAEAETRDERVTDAKSPGPSADDESAPIVRPGSVRKMAASIENREPRRSEAEALMRRVRALEHEAREGTGNLADAFADAT